MDQPEFNLLDSIRQQISDMAGDWVDITYHSHLNQFTILIKQSKRDILKLGLLPSALWKQCEEGIVASWVKDCGGVIEMEQKQSLQDDVFTFKVAINVYDIDQFEENVKRTGWDGYCQQFYAELEQELSKPEKK